MTEIFDIIVDYPDSMPALLDIKVLLTTSLGFTFLRLPTGVSYQSRSTPRVSEGTKKAVNTNLSTWR